MGTEKKHSIFSKVSETFLSILFMSLHPPSSCHVPSLNNSATILQITWRHGTWDSALYHSPSTDHCPALGPVPGQHDSTTRQKPGTTPLQTLCQIPEDLQGVPGLSLVPSRVSMEHHRTASTGLLLTFRECHKGADLERSPWVRSFPC